jgi:hypothetical protein
MSAKLAIDGHLIAEAQRLGNHRTKALREYVQRRKQLEVIDLFGMIDFDEDYDYGLARKQNSSELSAKLAVYLGTFESRPFRSCILLPYPIK